MSRGRSVAELFQPPRHQEHHGERKMTNVEARMTKECRNPQDGGCAFVPRLRHSCFVIRHSPGCPSCPARCDWAVATWAYLATWKPCNLRGERWRAGRVRRSLRCRT